MRIEVGYGLEGVLTDVTSRRIIAENVAPLFRQSKFAAGINAGVDRIIAVVGTRASRCRRSRSATRGASQRLRFRDAADPAVRRRAGRRRHPARDLRPLAGLDGRRRHRRRGRVVRRRLAADRASSPASSASSSCCCSAQRRHRPPRRRLDSDRAVAVAAAGGGGGFGGGGGGFSGGGGSFGGGGASGGW